MTTYFLSPGQKPVSEVSADPGTAHMQKWHQAIIQRVWLVEPLVIRENLSGSRWGMRVVRLGELARIYHDVSDIHRGRVVQIRGCAARELWPDHCYDGPIYTSEETCFGARLPKEARRTAVVRELPNAFAPTEVKVQQNEWLDDVRAKVAHLRRAAAIDDASA